MKILKKITIQAILILFFSFTLKADKIQIFPNIPPMMSAIIHNDVQTVQTLINNGTNINEIYPSRSPDTTALMLAARHGRIKIMHILIQNGANVNFQDKFGYTAIMRAARNGKFEALKILVQNGANINAYNSGKMSAVKFASTHNQRYSDKHIDMVKYLLQHGAKCTDLRTFPIYKKVCPIVIK